MSLSNLKRNRADFLDNLVTQAAKLNTAKNDYSDDRFWKPTRDFCGKWFMPKFVFFLKWKGEASPFVRYWDHFFKGPPPANTTSKNL